MIQSHARFGKRDLLHYHYLCELVANLDIIGESKNDAESIIIEPDWYKEDERGLYSLCDAFILYKPRLAIPVEYKHSSAKRAKAKAQLTMGKRYAEEVLFREVPYGKIVYYHNGKLDYEEVRL